MFVTIEDLDSIQNLEQASAFCEQHQLTGELGKIFLDHWLRHKKTMDLVAATQERTKQLEETTARFLETTNRFDSLVKKLAEAGGKMAEEYHRAVESTAAALLAIRDYEETRQSAQRQIEYVKNEFGVTPGRYCEFVL